VSEAIAIAAIRHRFCKPPANAELAFRFAQQQHRTVRPPTGSRTLYAQQRRCQRH
jgi:hypothetical protein